MDDDADLNALSSNEAERLTGLVEHERQAIASSARFHFVHWIVLALSVVMALAAWQYVARQIDLRTETRFNAVAEQTADLLIDRLEKYEIALWSGVSAIQADGEDLTAAQWHTFAVNLEIEQRYPGINGIGVIYEVAPDMVDAFLAKQRETRPEFSIFPAHGGEIFQPITYIEPVDINAKAIGLDMVHETNRHSSFNKARDTGTAQITGPIVLVQDKSRTPGFLFFTPFYEGMPHDTLASRQESFVGAVYAPFIVKNLIHGVLDEDRRTLSIRISDGADVIYDELGEQYADYDADALGVRKFVLDVYGREWVLEVRSGLEFRAENSGYEAGAILALGIGIDLTLFVLFVMLSRANRRGLRFADLATVALRHESEALRQTNIDLHHARTEAEGVSEMKSNFLATISHEVRTPLTAISGILALLGQQGLTAQQNEFVNAGKTASEKLIKLLTDVLDSSRLEANAVELWERHVALRPLIDEWQVLAEAMIEKLGKPIVVVTHVADCAPETAFIDDIRLAQVMNNLIDNAVRFTQSGTISITLCGDPRGTPNAQRFALILKDSGMGIPDHEMGNVFERFRQIDGSMTRATGGSGLGLAICHEVVKLLGGDITVASELHVGSAFTVTLPVEPKVQKAAKSG